MAEMIILAFDNREGALQARDKLLEVRRDRMLQLADAAIVVRQQDGKVQVKQLTNLVGTGAFGGAFWGLFIGILLAAPWLGLVAGAAAGAVAGRLADYGIDDNFIKEVGSTIEPGHSALFLLTHRATVEETLEELTEFNPTVMQTSLSPEDEAKLRDVFGADEIDA